MGNKIRGVVGTAKVEKRKEDTIRGEKRGGDRRR